MNKSTEIAILRQTAETLKNGYCGAWLAEQIPVIESSIRGDMMPGCHAMTLAEARKAAEDIIAEAFKKAQSMTEKAERDAAAVTEAARKTRVEILAATTRQLEAASESLRHY